MLNENDLDIDVELNDELKIEEVEKKRRTSSITQRKVNVIQKELEEEVKGLLNLRERTRSVKVNELSASLPTGLAKAEAQIKELGQLFDKELLEMFNISYISQVYRIMELYDPKMLTFIGLGKDIDKLVEMSPRKTVLESQYSLIDFLMGLEAQFEQGTKIVLL